MNKKLMKLFLENPSTVREAILSDNQVDILKFIRDEPTGYIYARDLADVDCCSIQLASTMLGRLYRKGYLKRTERVAETGGIEYKYSNAIDFK
jgi:DNA-binding MarR family transcriptional regulator